jgi:molybdopterin-guanine dinucleotide biosynthesis protein B
MKAFAVIGYHHSGKTTVVTELIKTLAAKGFKVATIKDIHSEQYHADTEGKNSWKHINAGSQMTFARGIHDSALIFPQSLSLNEMTRLLTCDYLIIEGMKEAPVPKILCAEDIDQIEELYDDTVFAISGKIASTQPDWEEPPIFDITTQSDKLTQLVLDKVVDLLPDSDPACCKRCGLTCYEMAAAIVKGERQRSECQTDRQQQLILSIDGKEITLVPFVQHLLQDLILAFVGNLKDADTQGNIKIELKQHD